MGFFLFICLLFLKGSLSQVREASEHVREASKPVIQDEAAEEMRRMVEQKRLLEIEEERAILRAKPVEMRPTFDSFDSSVPLNPSEVKVESRKLQIPVETKRWKKNRETDQKHLSTLFSSERSDRNESIQAHKRCQSMDGTKMVNTYSMPASATVKIYTQYPGETTTYHMCSGAIVSNYFVVTASHCIHDKSKGYAETVMVWPGQTDYHWPTTSDTWRAELDRPFGMAWGANYYSNTGWIGANQNCDSNSIASDFAVIVLDRPIGLRTDNFYLQLSNDAIYTPTELIGYPSDTCSGIFSYLRSFPVTNAGVSTEYYTFQATTEGGDSGGPSFHTDADFHYIQGVDSCGNGETATYCRLTQWKLDLAADIFRSDGVPSSKPALIEYTRTSAATSTLKTVISSSVKVGQSFQVKFTVYNVGFAATGTVTFLFYLSSLKYYSTQAVYLTSQTASSISASNIKEITSTLTMPNDSQWAGRTITLLVLWTTATPGYDDLFKELAIPVTVQDQNPSSCSEMLTCSDCTSYTTCGWCSSTASCRLGTPSGPTTGTCSVWKWNSPECSVAPTVPSDGCSNYKTCAECGILSCGWCETSSTCKRGQPSGPDMGGCGDWKWSASQCTRQTNKGGRDVLCLSWIVLLSVWTCVGWI